ncbi:Multimeric flavodoxin WrbA [Syntrophus gentianae]|uniref:Multimeric flavodoxin WrbA n=1 Tax=Syntrophus gentianae TaxID=43775 RepID=A0A1H7ZJM0_9BACT|nr:NAD(P)H-dependent oxidoreductase [Syntrophus gentianae]SEM58473.1 Multimeric flavodoxin WrbA [Syntrophus gentianae]
MPKTLKILCVYYSFSGQTRKLVQALTEGFSQEGGEVVVVRLHPLKKMTFPFPSLLSTLWMMFRTCFRVRDKVAQHKALAEDFDAVLIGGPTWSYSPSGPVLAWLDREGRKVLFGQKTLPLISCRGYWKLHYRALKRAILAMGGKPLNPLIFTHPVKEPWRSIGVFLSLIGKQPQKMPVIGRHYPGYGHSPEQIEEARRLGSALAFMLRDSYDRHSISGWRGRVD